VLKSHSITILILSNLYQSKIKIKEVSGRIKLENLTLLKATVEISIK
jgi:hypothetical protein